MKRYLISLLALFFTLSVSAQFYDSWNTYYYIEVGQSIESTNNVLVVHFDDTGNLYIAKLSIASAREKLEKHILKEYPINMKHNNKYDSETSTTRYTVYSAKRTQTVSVMPTPQNPWGQATQYMGGSWYHAFSKDRSEMIYWYTTRNSNEAQGKKYYKRINESDIELKPAHYDFL